MNKKEIKIRMTEEELAQLNNNVGKTGLSREHYLRLLVTDRVPIELPPADYRVIINQLNSLSAMMEDARNRPMTSANQMLLASAIHTVHSTATMLQMVLMPLQLGAFVPAGNEVSGNA